ncbi:hypothetical protein DMENIID0001_137690 [Sergentomyia squamirostris]
MSTSVVGLTKYVDDIFCLTPREGVENVLSKFNSFHPNLQFTVEVEKNGGIAYLDTYVIREGSRLNTIWYKKPIASDRMMNFFSQHPLQQKVSTAVGFLKRVQRLTTTNHENIKTIVFTRLKMNGYPPGLINTIWNKYSTQQQLHTTTESQNDDTNTTIYKSLTYIPGLSERIRRLLRSSISDLHISFKSNHTVKTLHTILKDRMHTEMQSGVVYCIQCECDKVYVGKTINRLKTRIYNHKYSVKQRLEGKTDQDATALVTHARENGHTFKYEEATILDRCTHGKQLEFLEMLHINLTSSQNVNKKTDTETISNIYSSLLHRMKQEQQSRERERDSFITCISSPDRVHRP